MAQATHLNDLDLDTIVALVEAIRADPANAATEWRADVHWEGGFRSRAAVRDLPAVPSDEPVALGGTDTAANPVEQVAAAFGHCLAVGYVAALTARGIAIRELDILVTGRLDLRPFLGIEPGHAGYSHIDVEARIDANTDPATLQAIHEHVVATSPVGHTLSNPVTVDVRLASTALTTAAIDQHS